MTEIQGRCDDSFEPVRTAFAAHFDQGQEQGASVAVTVAGEMVVDLWAGDADAEGRAWERDTIVNVYSTTKTMAAICMLMLADRGALDLDEPVATYWPEFAAAGKGGVLVRHVLGHTAGLPGFDPAIAPEVLYDKPAVAANLAAQAPWWPPGTEAGYHAITQGELEAEIVRRVTGQTLGTFFRTEVAEPLGADFAIGLPASEDGRVADLVPPEAGIAGAGDLVEDAGTGSIALRTLASCPLTGFEPRTRAWRGAELPAVGGTGNARSIGRIHSALACGGAVDGVRLLSLAGVERVLEEQFDGIDHVLGVRMRHGMGFGLMSDLIPLSPNPRSFFWGGWGGSIAVIDLDAQMTVSYAMNRMAPRLLGDLRGALLTFAAYASLAA